MGLGTEYMMEIYESWKRSDEKEKIRRKRDGVKKMRWMKEDKDR